jgi:serine/threonine protein kinase
VPGYQFVEKVGEGRLGAVYKAARQRGGELVAVKMIPAERWDASIDAARFEEEFRLASHLEHPNLARVKDFGRAGEAYFLVSEFVDGTPLAKRIETAGRIKESEAVGIALQVASALTVAHQAGIAHREVKPENILLTPEGRVKLTDLGILKVFDRRITVTQSATGPALFNYMAPEVFEDPKNADPRCDVYSLGATLYAAVTGQVPFRAPTPLAVLTKKLSGDLAPAWSLVPGLSEHIDRAISRALNPSREQRHGSCEEFMTDLTGRKATRIVRVCRMRAAPAISPSEKAPAEGKPAKRSGKEHRKAERYKSGQEGRCLPLAGHEEDQWTASLNDVSLTGVSLIVGRRFELGSLLTLWLPPLGDLVSGKLIVRVVRRESRPGRKWLLGCEFTHKISEEELQLLL